ncbi:uncharacterized protein LOC134529242 isoform X2 [Bacillus rossius redtenbacheri]|uniref:uncharacterized protein LOC134529242 isoform X2 n=1 Tax=Bacillus rossius redtenbacheri TaxID=93214 RepID=UPI002FDE625A
MVGLYNSSLRKYMLSFFRSSTPTRKNGDPSNVGATGSDGSILLDMDTCQINVIESAYTEPSAANDSLASQEVSRYLLPSSTPTRKNGDPSNVGATGSDGSILLDMDTCQINVIESAYTEPSAANDPSLTHEVPLSPLPELLIESRHEVGDKDSNLNNIEGRRICDIRHVITKARQLEKHNLECKARIKGYFTYTGEKRIGLRSVLHFKCTSCDARTSIDTDPSDTVNTAATWGTVMSGKGHAVIEQLFSLMEIPPASSSTFMKEEREIGKVWFESLTEAMEQAAKEEHLHALEEGHVDDDGIPYITVIVDGGWSHRSYGHSYNAKSGVAIIIGKKTGKMLFLGIRNKYCSICSLSEKRNEQPTKHICYKNWSSCSSAMKSDILVEGFKASEETHGLRYFKYIGDGDSSVQKSIVERVPYGLKVVKIECTNHLLKNLYKHLLKLSKENSGNKKILTPARMKHIQNRIRHLITEESRKDCPSVSSLKNDIRATIEHVFGNHGNCRIQNCPKAKITSITDLDTAPGNLAARIISIIGNLAAKSDSLVENLTSNAAETYMHLAARFNDGKQSFFGRRGSFNTRCYGAGLSFQHGPAWLHTVWKKKVTFVA